MVVPLTLLLLAAAPHPAPVLHQSDPAVKVWLADDRIDPGSWARVKVRVADDGYLLVLAADPQGYVRVLFPQDPGDDAFVRGGRTLDLRGRGGRGSFLVGEAGGAGVVLAARTAQPLRFDGFVRGDHWAYGALDSAAHGASAAQQSPDDMLLGLAQQMAGGNQLDYDAATYTVNGAMASAGSPYIDGGYAPTYDYGYAYPSWYGCYDPWMCGPGFFGGFGLGVFFSPFGYRPYVYRPYVPWVPVVRGYPRVLRAYASAGYRDRRYIPSPQRVPYRGRGIGAAPMRSFGGVRVSRGAAPRFSAPRMAAPSFRGGRGGFVGRGGGGRRGR